MVFAVADTEEDDGERLTMPEYISYLVDAEGFEQHADLEEEMMTSSKSLEWSANNSSNKKSSSTSGSNGRRKLVIALGLVVLVAAMSLGIGLGGLIGAQLKRGGGSASEPWLPPVVIAPVNGDMGDDDIFTEDDHHYNGGSSSSSLRIPTTASSAEEEEIISCNKCINLVQRMKDAEKPIRKCQNIKLNMEGTSFLDLNCESAFRSDNVQQVIPELTCIRSKFCSLEDTTTDSSASVPSEDTAAENNRKSDDITAIKKTDDKYKKPSIDAADDEENKRTTKGTALPVAQISETPEVSQKGQT